MRRSGHATWLQKSIKLRHAQIDATPTLIRERWDVVSPQEGVGSARGIWGVEAREGGRVAVPCRLHGDVEVDGSALLQSVAAKREIAVDNNTYSLAHQTHSVRKAAAALNDMTGVSSDKLAICSKGTFKIHCRKSGGQPVSKPDLVAFD